MTEPLDRAKIHELLDLTGGERSWLDDLFQAYVSDTRDRLEQLGRLLPGGPAPEVQRAAHAVKGASSSVGAREVADRSHAVEMLARDGDLVGAAEELPALQRAFEAVLVDIPRVLGRS